MNPEDPQPVVDSAKGKPRYDLGILLVHGIGESREGETLVNWGQALVQCLKDWLGVAGVESSIVSANLRGSGSGPAHGEVEIAPVSKHWQRFRELGVESQSRWLIAESWWAETFPAPSYGQLAIWSLGVFPGTIVSHFDRRFRRSIFGFKNVRFWRRRIDAGFQIAKEALYLLLALLLLPIVLSIVLLVLGIGLVPGPLRSLAVSIQRLLSGYIGDSFMLVGNHVAAEAIYQRVRSDLDWLAPQCDRVAILAHSQGGAVTHECLRRDARAPCDLLMTFGSGLRKLSEIRQVERSGGKGLLIFAIGGTWLAGVGVAGGINLFGFLEGAAYVGWVGAVVGLAATAVAMWRWQVRTARSVQKSQQWNLDQKIFDERFRLPNPRTRWLDVYASADVVSNGPLLDDLFPEGMESYEVANRGSSVADHTSYFNARDQFVWNVAEQLLLLCGIQPSELRGFETANDKTPAGPEKRGSAASRRAWRVAWSSHWRKLIAVATAVLVVLWRDDAPEQLHDALASIHGWIDQIPIINSWLPDEPAVGLWSLAGIGLPLAVSLVIYLVGTGLWIWWDQLESGRALRGQTARWWEIPGLLFIGLWLAMFEVAVRTILAGKGLPWDTPIPWSMTAVTALYLIAWFFRGQELVGPIVGLRGLIAVDDPQRLLENQERLERKRLERECDAGNPKAMLDLGWQLQREAAAEDSDPKTRRDKRKEAVDLYQRAIAAGEPGASWYLGELWREELERRKQDKKVRETAQDQHPESPESRDEAAHQRAETRRDEVTLEPEEHELRLNMIEAYREGVKKNDDDMRIVLSRILWEEGKAGQQEAETVLSDGIDRDHAGCIRELSERLCDLGRHEEARELYELAVERDPVSSAALGSLAERLGDAPAAISHYRTAFEGGNDNVARQLSDLLIADGRVGDAEEVLKQGVERSDPASATALGEFLESASNREAAGTAFQQALRFSRTSWDGDRAALGLARVYRSQGDEGAAVKVLEHAVHKLSSADIAIELAGLLAEQEDADRAAAAWMLALDLVRSEKSAWSAFNAASAYARSLVDAGEIDKAVSILQDVVDEFQSSLAARELAGIHRANKDYAPAIDAAKKAVELAQGSEYEELAAAIDLGNVFAEAGEIEQAESTLKTAAGKANPDGSLALARFQQERERWDCAISEFRKALRKARVTGSEWVKAEAVRGLVAVYSRLGRFGRAECILCAAVQSNGSAGLAIDLARFREDACDFEGAAEAYRWARALAISETSSWVGAMAVTGLARLHETAGELSNADNLLSAAEEEFGAQVGIALGRLRAKAGDYEGAEGAYLRAIASERESNEAWHVRSAISALASLYENHGHLERAEALLEGESGESDTYELFSDLGRIHEKQGQLLGAIKSYERAMKAARATGNHEAVANLAMTLAKVHEERSDIASAEGLVRTVVSESPTTDNLRELGRLQIALGDRSEAIENYQRALELAKDDDRIANSISRDLAELLAEAGQASEAASILAQVAVGSVDAALDRGGLLESAGEVQAALTVYLDVLEHPQLSEQRWLVHSAAAAAIRVAAALERPDALTKIVELVAARFEPWDVCRLARVFIDLEFQERGLATFRIAQEMATSGDLSEDAEPVISQVSSAFVEATMVGEAIEILTEAVDVFGFSGAAVDLGRLHMEQDNLGEAEARFEQAVDLARKSDQPVQAGHAVVALANLYERQNDVDRATTMLRDAVGEFESFDVAYRLGQMLQRRGQSKDAIEAFRKAVEMTGDDAFSWEAARAMIALASVLEADGNRSEAVDLLESAATDHESAPALLELGSLREASWASDAYSRALVVARRKNDSWTADRAAAKLASFLEQQGDANRALKILWATAKKTRSTELQDEFERLLETSREQ